MKLDEDLLELDRKTTLGQRVLNELDSETDNIKRETTEREIGNGWNESKSIDQYSQLVAETTVEAVQKIADLSEKNYNPGKKVYHPLVVELEGSHIEKYSKWIENSLNDVSAFLDNYSEQVDTELKEKMRGKFKEQIKDSNIKYRDLRKPSRLVDHFQSEAT